MSELAGRAYARVYQVQGREDVFDFLRDAVEASGGEVLYASPTNRAPLFLGVQTAAGDRLGLLIYHFRMTHREILHRPPDEVRGQIRYGSESSWHTEDHPIGHDVAGVDITLMLGVEIERGVLIGLQPAIYGSLPMGISFYSKAGQLEHARERSWAVWQHETARGSRRALARGEGSETVIAFTPDRLLDYAYFERRSTDLGLDPSLRHSLALDAGEDRTVREGPVVGLHQLEEDFDLSSREIVEIIASRRRLHVAVLGGVAEHHLERELRGDSQVHGVVRLDVDGEHDFDVELVDGRDFRVECKNASPTAYANGDYKVEVQKTRGSKGDPASRFYRVNQFDVVAACLFSPTHEWEFRYQRTCKLAEHDQFPGRLAAMQRVDATWTARIADLTS